MLKAGSLNFQPIQTTPNTYIFYAETRRKDISIQTCTSSTRTAIKLIIKPLPNISINSNAPICSNDTLKLSSGNSESGAVYQWSGSNGFTSNESNPKIIDAQPFNDGYYQLKITSNGCEIADSIFVKIKPLPIAMPTATKDSICLGENIHLNAFDAGIGTSYEWNGVNSFYSMEQNPTISAASISNSGKYILKTTLEGCSSSDTIQIVVNEKPIISVDSATCSPDLKTYQIFFKNSVGSTVSASAGIVSTNIISAIPADSASVTIRVVYTSGCYSEIIVNKPDCNCKVIEAPISLGDTSYCEGNTIPILKVKVGNFQTADWYDAQTGGNKLFSGLNYLPAAADTFYVEARDTVSQCKSTNRTPIILKINNLPSFQLNSISSACLGSNPQNNGRILISDVSNGEKFDIVKDTVYSGNQTFSTANLIPSDGILLEKLHNSTTDITYTVRVFNEFGCFTDKQIVLKASACLCPETICVPFQITKTKSKKQ